MKKKSNEWVSIADLMSGVMAVVMLLLVISVLQNTYAEMKHKQQLEGSRDSQQKNMIKTLNDIKQEVSLQGGTDLIDFNIEQGTITLKDSIFAQGSACITPKAAHAFTNIKGKIDADEYHLDNEDGFPNYVNPTGISIENSISGWCRNFKGFLSFLLLHIILTSKLFNVKLFNIQSNKRKRWRMIYESILDLIGNTPIIKLKQIFDEKNNFNTKFTSFYINCFCSREVGTRYRF